MGELESAEIEEAKTERAWTEEAEAEEVETEKAWLEKVNKEKRKIKGLSVPPLGNTESPFEYVFLSFDA